MNLTIDTICLAETTQRAIRHLLAEAAGLAGAGLPNSANRIRETVAELRIVESLLRNGRKATAGTVEEDDGVDLGALESDAKRVRETCIGS